MNSIKFNGHEVKNPLARAGLMVLIILVSLGVVALILFAILPLVGLAVTGTLAVALVVVLAIIPLAMLKNISTGSNIDFGSHTGELPDQATGNDHGN